MILQGVGQMGDNETDGPEDGGEESGDDGEQEAAHHCHPGREDPGLGLQVRMVHRRHQVHPAIGGQLGHAGSPHHLGAGVQGHLQEGNCHGEQHPDVKPLDIGGDWQALRDSKEPANQMTEIFVEIHY